MLVIKCLPTRTVFPNKHVSERPPKHFALDWAFPRPWLLKQRRIYTHLPLLVQQVRSVSSAFLNESIIDWLSGSLQVQTLKYVSRFLETDKEFKTKSSLPTHTHRKKPQIVPNAFSVPRVSIYVLVEDRVLRMKELSEFRWMAQYLNVSRLYFLHCACPICTCP